MTENIISLSDPDLNNFEIRTIVEDDIELLRTWKNAFRNNFFFKEIITNDMQKKWFKSYSQRDDDFILILVNNGERIGCIGFRQLEDRVDLYNLIIGCQQNTGQGYMARALSLIYTETKNRYPESPVMASVLRDNSDLDWYYRRGFKLTNEHEDHLELTLNI